MTKPFLSYVFLPAQHQTLDFNGCCADITGIVCIEGNILVVCLFIL